MIKEGKYIAKAVDYCMTLTDKGDPMVAVQFETEEDGYHIVWRGNLTHPKGLEIAIKALKVLNFAGTEKELALGPESGCIDTDKAVEIDVALEEYNGKQYAKVQWVNEVGGGGFKNKLTAIEAVRACAGLNLAAEFVQAGISTKPVARNNPVAQSEPTEEIPF